jgi:hypothetical protein
MRCVAMTVAGWFCCAAAATLNVGPGKEYAKPCAAIAKARAGDLIEIDGSGNYDGDVCGVTANNLILRGVNGRPKLNAAGKIAQDKAIWVIAGNDTTVENIEFTGAKSSAYNGAGIRQEGRNLTVRNCHFHHNENGILAGVNHESTIVVEFSEFGYNGSGDAYSHNIYIGEVGKFVFRYNYSHHANVGNLVKTRAIRSYILYNRIDDEDGVASWELDVPNGGQTFVIGNVIHQGRRSTNFNMMSYVTEGLGAPHTNLSRLYIVNNTFINDMPRGVFILINPRAPLPAFIKNNLFVGQGQITTQESAHQETNAQVDNSVFTDRGAFNLKPFSGSIEESAGTDPGIRSGFPLQPTLQYAHPACVESRVDPVGRVTLGAVGASGGNRTCSSNGVPKVSVRATPAEFMIRPGGRQQLSAQVSGTADQRVRWVVEALDHSGEVSPEGVFTAPESVDRYQLTLVTAVSVADPTEQDAATVTLLPPESSPVIIRLNAGNGALRDDLGPWSEDFGYTGGTPQSVDVGRLSNSLTPSMYRFIRIGRQFSYTFHVPNGSYRVRLHFNDWINGPGLLMKVTINNEPVLQDFDIIGVAGANGVDYDRVFPVEVTNKKIVLDFSSTRGYAIVNGIEIVPNTGVSVAVDPDDAWTVGSEGKQFRAVVSGSANQNVRWFLSPAIGTISPDGFYQPPAGLNGYTVVRVRAVPEADPMLAATAMLRVVPANASGRAILRVNVGGPAVTDSLGRSWAADVGCTGGNGNLAYIPVSGSSAPEVMSTARAAGGAIKCSYAVPDGQYRLVLHFAELWPYTPGKRVINVDVNGSRMVSNLDVAGESDSAWAAVAKVVPVTAVNSQVSIELTAAKDRPLLNGLELLPVSEAPLEVAAPFETLQVGETADLQATIGGNPVPVTWSLEPAVGKISADGRYAAPSATRRRRVVTVYAISKDDPSNFASTRLVIEPAPGPAIYRLNVGGPVYTDSNGNVWDGDNLGESNGTHYVVSPPITGTDDPFLYRTQRYKTTGFEYQFEVPNGNYRVVLKFAELGHSTGGNRIFHVAINGDRLLTNFDAAAEARGGRRAIDRAFDVTVTTGRIVLTFSPVKDAVMVNAIEIIPAELVAAEGTFRRGLWAGLLLIPAVGGWLFRRRRRIARGGRSGAPAGWNRIELGVADSN